MCKHLSLPYKHSQNEGFLHALFSVHVASSSSSSASSASSSSSWFGVPSSCLSGLDVVFTQQNLYWQFLKKVDFQGLWEYVGRFSLRAFRVKGLGSGRRKDPWGFL